jgi:hypothetical protein
VINQRDNTMTMNQSAFFAAGRAIGLLEVGLPADIALSDVPTMRPQDAAKILRAPARRSPICRILMPVLTPSIRGEPLAQELKATFGETMLL